MHYAPFVSVSLFSEITGMGTKQIRQRMDTGEIPEVTQMKKGATRFVDMVELYARMTSGAFVLTDLADIVHEEAKAKAKAEEAKVKAAEAEAKAEEAEAKAKMAKAKAAEAKARAEEAKAKACYSNDAEVKANVGDEAKAEQPKED